MTGVIAGKSASIGLGDSIKQVIRILGNPHDVSTCKEPLVYKYGILEIMFEYNDDMSDKLCCFFGIHFCQLKYVNKNFSYNFPLQLKPDSWFPSHDTRPEELEEYFSKNEISWQFYPYMTDEDEPAYIARYAVFDFQNGLNKMFISNYHQISSNKGLALTAKQKRRQKT